MPKTTPLALLALLVVLAVALVSPSMAATTRAHRHAHTTHAAQQSARTTHSATHKPRRAAHLEMKPRSRQAMRAHARIRAELARRRRHGHLEPLPAELKPARLIIPPPLRGSHESLVHQNAMAEAEGLERILDDEDLQDRIAHGSLVPVPVSASLRVNQDLPADRRYCRPWTAKFLSDLSRAHADHFAGSPIEVTSAVRTVEYQRRLRHINGNAAAADGDVASPHLTGGTIDIGKTGMSAREIGWLRSWLIPLEQQGKIDVEEEFKQSCFHISVYKTYAEVKPPTHAPASTTPHVDGSMLATHGR